ncbi:glucose 1-dehydrogenase [Legionella cincinnatiensis]|uniref:Acetyoacetyl CoA reductase n=1 Tax=Legionella cincinnatiensis TaxID=28085 RepID=A0A378IPM3_9GAMM|nr:glucose 1-dehydrogenase [Legionella cincinnatiensis]KTC93414.1 acetyoacetyl CoA reductase [Legionella cincinnatiensis]STX36585.1 acetyoacetyl CoA reductase [Legionella cincinnatiensis]
MHRLRGKVAMITGGRRGIGRAIAKLLAQEGASVAITDRKADGADEVIDDITEHGGKAIFIEHDVSQEEDWQKAIAQVQKNYGKLDVVVNNAGVGVGKNIEEISLKDWRWVMSVNLDGVFLGTKYAIKSMKSTGGGSIINIASIEGLIGDRRLAAYDASKGAVRLLTKSAALHCAKAKYNIRVNAVCPGFLDTKMVEGFLASQENPQQAKEELVNLHPIGHLGEPLDVAYAVLYLASEESKFVTGSDLIVDGGYSAR